MTTFPEHKLAQFGGVCDMDGRFLLISSDDAMEQESFRDIFGSDLPYVKSDYSYFFIYQTEDITVYYGCAGTPYTDEDVDLLYFAESGNDQIYSPYFGSHLEESPVWGYATTDGVDDIEITGLVPYTDETDIQGNGNCFVGYTTGQNPRLVLFYTGSDEFANHFSLSQLKQCLKIWQKDKWFKARTHDVFIRHYTQLIKLANQWGIK